MFPSDNNNSEHEKASLMIHQTPPLIFSNFPSPFFDEHESIMPFDQGLDIVKPTENAAKREKPDNEEPPASKRRNVGKRSGGKKDRHSKIRTAQGIRDRRMRLSLQIARKFFDLQDMLGYDKASSTIEWLFSKSRKAIKELMATTKDAIIDSFSAGGSDSFLSDEGGGGGGVEVSSATIIPKKKATTPRKTARKPNNRESREKARARARWRTREKMMIKLGFESCSVISNNNYDNSPNWNSQRLLGFGNSDQQQDVGTIEKLLLGNSSFSSSTTISTNFSPIDSENNYYQCCIDPSINLMGFLGNWDLLMTNHQLSSGHNNFNVHPSSPNFTLFHQ